MHPYSAGYRTPSRRQILILVLSALAGVIVAGIYFAAAFPSRHVPPVPAQQFVRQRPSLSPEDSTVMVVCSVLFFAATHATGMALYRFFGSSTPVFGEHASLLSESAPTARAVSVRLIWRHHHSGNSPSSE
jgi:hypothetical protein